MSNCVQGLHKVLDARQLGLKYIANVTYGYTSATFSGRMPAVEIADSIVQSGRETLEKVGHTYALIHLFCILNDPQAIALVDSTPKWGAKVVYGDTDSMFMFVAFFRSTGSTFLMIIELQTPTRKDERASISHWPRYRRYNHIYEPGAYQTQVRKSVPRLCLDGEETLCGVQV